MADVPEYLSLSTADPAAAGRPPFTVGVVLSLTFSTLLPNLVPFLVLATLVESPVIAIYLAYATEFADPRQAWSTWPLVAMFLSMILHQIVTAAVTFGVFEHLRGRRPSWGRCIVSGLRKTPAAIVTGICVGILVSVGGIFCFAPGIYFMVIFSVAVPVTVLEGKLPFSAMSRSKALTVGHGWPILGAYLAVVLSLSVLSVAGSLALMSHPLMRAAWLSVYQVVGTMLQATLMCVIYYRLRLTEEDLDLAEIAKVFE